MSEIHYFQRYSQRENVVTNNTLLLFSRLYNHSPNKFKVFINDLIDGIDLDVGVSFKQQSKASRSVPDGQISQIGFRIIFETKLTNNFNVGQLEKHLDFLKNEDQAILIGLSPTRIPDETTFQVNEMVKQFNLKNGSKVIFISLTFYDIIQKFESVISDFEIDLKAVFDDYNAFCIESNLLVNSDLRMLAVNCGKTLPLNFQFNVYFDPANRSNQPFTLLGLYSDKSIHGIGRLLNIITAELDGEKLKILKSTGKVTDEQKENIVGIIREVNEKLGWSIGKGHKFYCVEAFLRTLYTKTTKHAIPGKKYFNLTHDIGASNDDDLAEIAEKLKATTWPNRAN